MRRIIHICRGAVAAGLVLACSAEARATPIPSGTTIADDLLINFDFFGATPAPPYFDVFANFIVTLTVGETVMVDAFDGLNGTSLVESNPLFGPLVSFFYNCTCPFLTDGRFSVGLRMVAGSAELTSFPAIARSPAGASVTISGTVATPAAVPEPATFALVGLGLAGLVARRRRRQQ